MVPNVGKYYNIFSVGNTFVDLRHGVNPKPPTANTNPIVKVEPVSFSQRISQLNKNPLLSFMRGSFAQNIPLGEEAINTRDGYIGMHLNVIG